MLHEAPIAVVGRTIVGVGQIRPIFVTDERIDARNHVALPGFFATIWTAGYDGQLDRVAFEKQFELGEARSAGTR